MNKKSLEKELKKLKHYLKTIDSKENFSSTDKTIVSHTLVGMIMSIHNLIKTGAYDQNDAENKELFQTIHQARNTAIHYGFFNDLNSVYKEAQNIVALNPENMSNNFANIIPSMSFDEDEIYYQVAPTCYSKICESYTLNDHISFKNINNQETLYVRKEDLIIVENEHSHSFNYLLKSTEDKNLFYKKSDNDETIKINFNEFMKSAFSKNFIITNKGNKLSSSVNKILKSLKDDEYKNLNICYKYDNKNINVTAHNVLNRLLYKRTIEEKIFNGNFSLFEHSDIEKLNTISINFPIKDMVNSATLTDLFYIELYLKKYNAYKQLKEHYSPDEKLANYYKQSILVNLFETGVSALSDKFIESDRTKNFKNFYYDFKSMRNELAHGAITNPKEKENLISNIESYTETFHQIVDEVFKEYTKLKSKDSHIKLPPLKKLDSKHYVLTNKTNRFISLEHDGMCKMIKGKKYLKLKTQQNHTYVEIDGTILSIDYDSLLSKKCLTPLDHARFVHIDNHTNEIKSTSFTPNNCQLIYLDQYMETCIQAHDVLKSYPQIQKRNNPEQFIAITYLNNNQEAIYTEGIKNLIYRRLSQKVLPCYLDEASSLVIPTNTNEPLQIINKNKTIIAKVYHACINNIDGKEIVKQILKDGSQTDIDYGRLLPKDLKANELIITTKEVKK